MTKWKNYIALPLLILLIRQFILHLQDPTESVSRVKKRLKKLVPIDTEKQKKVNDDVIVITAVACGNIERLEELSVMIKSAVIFRHVTSFKL